MMLTPDDVRLSAVVVIVFVLSCNKIFACSSGVNARPAAS